MSGDKNVAEAVKQVIDSQTSGWFGIAAFGALRRKFITVCTVGRLGVTLLLYILPFLGTHLLFRGLLLGLRLLRHYYILKNFDRQTHQLDNVAPQVILFH